MCDGGDRGGREGRYVHVHVGLLCVMEEAGEGGRESRCAVCDGGDRGGREGR